MPTAADARKIALSFDGVKEVDHWDRPAFRTTRRIFAVIRPDGLWLHLPEERKEFLFEADPDAFHKTMWGKHPELIVQLVQVGKQELKVLMREAWEHAAPPPTKPKRRAAAAGKPARK